MIINSTIMGLQYGSITKAKTSVSSSSNIPKTLSFTVAAKPKCFALVAIIDTPYTQFGLGERAVIYDGTNVTAYAIEDISYTTTRAVVSSTSRVSWSYSNGTLTITTTGKYWFGSIFNSTMYANGYTLHYWY